MNSACLNSSVRGDIQPREMDWRTFFFGDCNEAHFRSSPSMKLYKMGLNCPVDVSEFSFVGFSLTTSTGYYSYLKLYEAASFNATFFSKEILQHQLIFV